MEAVARPSTSAVVHALDEVAGLLDDISAEGLDEFAGIVAGIRKAFAYRRAGILQTVPRHQVAAVLKALAAEQRGAMASAKEKRRADMRARQRRAQGRRQAFRFMARQAKTPC